MRWRPKLAQNYLKTTNSPRPSLPPTGPTTYPKWTNSLTFLPRLEKKIRAQRNRSVSCKASNLQIVSSIWSSTSTLEAAVCPRLMLVQKLVLLHLLMKSSVLSLETRSTTRSMATLETTAHDVDKKSKAPIKTKVFETLKEMSEFRLERTLGPEIPNQTRI